MKKQIFAMMMALLCVVQIKAQTINKTYHLNGYDLIPKCVAPKPDDSIIFISANILNAQVLPSKFIMIKTDGNGVFKKALVIDTAFWDHRIRETADGVLLASHADSNLYVIKFDNLLNNMWSKRIPIGTLYNYSHDGSIDIEIAHESGQEVYYITSLAPTFNAGYRYDDVAFSVTKLDNNGQLLWRKRYADPNRSNIATANIFDEVQSITVADSVDTTFVIAGARGEYDPFFPANRYLFVMAINANGDPVTNYQKVQTRNNWVWNPDVLWDKYHNAIVCSFNEDLGLVTLNTSLTPVAGKAFQYGNPGLANTISMMGDSFYVISNYVRDPLPPFRINPSFLKIDANTLHYTAFSRYNIYSEVRFEGYHRDDDYDYNYGVGFNTHNNNGTNTDVRLLKVDQMLSDCGVVYDQVNEFDYTPVDSEIFYQRTPDTAIENYSYHYWTPNLSETTCDEDSADYYKGGTTTVFNTGIEKGIAVSVYPTLLHSTDETVNCVITAQKKTTGNVVVYNVLGQQSYVQEVNIVPGEKKIEIPRGLMSKGLNMVRISVNGKLVDITKVLVTE